MSAEHTRRIIAEGKAEAARLKELRMEQEREAREESVADRVRRKAKAEKPRWMDAKERPKSRKPAADRKETTAEMVARLKWIVSNLSLPYPVRSSAAKKLHPYMTGELKC